MDVLAEQLKEPLPRRTLSKLQLETDMKDEKVHEWRNGVGYADIKKAKKTSQRKAAEGLEAAESRDTQSRGASTPAS